MTRNWLNAALLTVLLSSGRLLHGQFKPADPSQYPAQPPVDTPDPSNPDGLEQPDPADAQHAVARLSFLSGEVNVQRGDNSAGTVAAAINAPLLSTDRLQTGVRSSAEIQLDAGTVIRAAENTDIGFGALDSNGFQAQLGTGSVIFRVVNPGPLQGELDTPNIAIHPLGAADLRVSVLADGTTLVQVRSGDAELIGPAGNESLSSGHAYIVRGNPTDPEFQDTALAPQDGFDTWSAGRDAQIAQSQSAQYLPPEVPGAADLDANGNWVPSEYGQVWTPSGVPANWAPYSAGSWTYENYYGWTWIDSSPWGWAPYHYGRWFRNANYGWCWWPGARAGVHPWRPALVGFYGWGGGYRGLGWVPLAPHERFHAWWGNGARAYGNGFTGSYRNASYRGAVTFASYHGFAGPGQRFGHLSPQQLAGAAPLGGRIPVTPARASYSFSQRQAYSVTRSTTFTSRSFVSSSQFRTTRQSGFASRPSYNGSGFGTTPRWSRVGTSRSVAPGNTRVYPTSTPRNRTPSAGDSGWRRFGDPGNANTYRQGSSASPSSRSESGWHDFGRPASPSASPGRQWNNGNQSRPSNNAPQRFSAPQQQRSAPAPRNNGGGGNSSGRGGGHDRGGQGRH